MGTTAVGERIETGRHRRPLAACCIGNHDLRPPEVDTRALLS